MLICTLFTKKKRLYLLLCVCAFTKKSLKIPKR